MPTQIQLLKKYRLLIRGHSGQHFLIDPNVQRKLVDLLKLHPTDRVVEIGPGLGALTSKILESGAKVWAVEKDRRFVEILAEEFGRNFPDQLTIIHQDILKLDLRKFMPQPPSPRIKFKVISNLPYYVTTPVLFYLIENRCVISQAVLTLQKEVAARLVARPGAKDYSRLTLALRLYARIDHAFDIHSKCFTPSPDVDSSTVILTFYPESKLPAKADQEILLNLFQIAFSQRRKTLLHLLSRHRQISKSRIELQKIFESVGIPENARGEELLLKDYLALAQILFGRRKQF
ncbi:MAG: 16S rRNA (adenine(1518)-N(6)/adenine(1519)-N(6))-dimethyltransferase RsmA [Candidatus Omnitrophica bacterium]|nr:16S rRNA (adenine(1518)-N(6)/adenine(1519)-N(6))-dimethyltransferase RsmA [Candidatus Omnitrophota bacterium]